MKRLTYACLAGIFLLAATGLVERAFADQRDPAQIWRLGSGHMTLEIRGDYLPDFGIEIVHEGRVIDSRERLRFPVRPVEPMRIYAPWGIFNSLLQDSGRLQVDTGLILRRGDREIRMDSVQVVPGERAGHPLFVAVDAAGNVLFTLSHVHLVPDSARGRVTIANAEVEASAYFARQLGLEKMAGTPIGLGWLDLAMSVPDDAVLAGTPPGCSERPIWPQEGTYEADVTLIGMGNIAYQGTQSGTGLVKTAPSATLKNEGFADIPWIGHFDELALYSYTPADQHPFLVWNIYKIADGRMEMLAGSGVKHAFLTVNVNCTSCGSSHVLWPECEDTYSAGNNDTSTYQGPRDEIETSLGLWENCGSFFDPGCTGNQTQGSGQWLNRLLIDPAEFQQPDTQYFMDAWYVVQYDNDIWNTMGFRPIDPIPSGGGWFMNPGSFTQGPVISQWVPENENDPLADHDVITIPSETPDAAYPDNMPQGHLRLLVKVAEVSPGRYRYNYALQNYDFDRAMKGFRIDLNDGATVYETWFGDIDSDSGNDWTVTSNPDHVQFDAPSGNPLTWFTLFNFEIETDAPPVTSQVRLALGSSASQPSINITTIGPSGAVDMIFGDRFAQLGSRRP